MSVPQASPVFIYGLCDPHTGELRYVGKTRQKSLNLRLKQHICDAKTGRNRYCSSWIKSLLSKGLKPDIFAIEESTQADWLDAERFWISYFRFVGCALTNHTSGGDCSCEWTTEMRAKMSAAKKGKTPWNVGKKTSEETRAKQRAAKLGKIPWNLGKKMSEESKARVSASKKAMMTDEIRNKLRLKRLGTKLSAEHIAKLRGRVSWMKGKKHTEEAINKLAKSYEMIAPDGTQHSIRNLKRFSDQQGLSYKCMNHVARGAQKEHRGWTVKPPS